MSDYQDFCESYGGCASDPDFMDKWLDEYANDEVKAQPVKGRIKTTSSILGDILPAGKLVHIIKLLASYPAKPMGIVWNKELTTSLTCAKANHLNSTDHDDPASWFIRKGFTVRSTKINGYWYQVVFKETNSQTQLNERDRKDYESICSSLNPKWVRNCK